MLNIEISNAYLDSRLRMTMIIEEAPVDKSEYLRVLYAAVATLNGQECVIITKIMHGRDDPSLLLSLATSEVSDTKRIEYFYGRSLCCPKVAKHGGGIWRILVIACFRVSQSPLVLHVVLEESSNSHPSLNCPVPNSRFDYRFTRQPVIIPFH